MASWKGAISFGLVSVAVALEPATEEQKVPMHQIHIADHGRVRQKRWCEIEDREIPYAEIAREYEAGDGRAAMVTNEDLSGLPVPTKKTIDVLGFVDQGEIDPIYFGKPYYVSPDKATAAKPYALLREAMAGTGRVAVTKITLSTRENPAVLRVSADGTLVLQLMVWPAEIRAAGAPPGDAGLRPQEIAMARSLVETMTADFGELTAELHDDYQDALRDLVEAKLEGAEPPHEAPVRVRGDNVVDLMTALERSVKAAQGGRHANEPAPARKSAAKRPAKKTAAKKSAGTRRVS